MLNIEFLSYLDTMTSVVTNSPLKKKRWGLSILSSPKITDISMILKMSRELFAATN